MRPTSQILAPPAAAQAAASAPLPVTAAARAPAPSAQDTPRQLRRLSLLLVVAGLLVSLVGTVAMVLLLRTLDRARDDSAQLIRVQRIQTDLLVADANATNTFLVGGLEAPERRAAYEAALAEVSSLVSTAAQAQPADAAALSTLNAQVLDYATLVESARANNRQGFPVGAQYLREASAGLRSDILPVADALVSTNADRARQAMGVGWGWALVTVTVLALATYVVAQVWVARRFHRRVNPGLLGATVVLLSLLLAGTGGLLALGGSVRAVRDNSFADVNALAAARIQANLAKSSESLTLVARGSGQPYEQAWQQSSAAVVAQLEPLRDADPVLTRWRGYQETHAEIRRLDDGGQWDRAVALATGSGPGTSNGTFAPVDDTLGRLLEGSGATTERSLAGYRSGLVVGALLTFLAGLAAAGLGRRGLAARLREYR